MTWHPSASVLLDAFNHAEACAPMESCGLVVAGQYRPLANQSSTPHSFAITAKDMVIWKSQGDVEAIVHSHVGVNPIASEWDVDQCKASGLPWLILSVPQKDFVVIEPPGLRAPLVGREFKWGERDCFSLARDAYFDFAGMVIPDMPREWEWWKHGENLIADHFGDLGFVSIGKGEEIQHLDVIGMKVKSDVINHLAVFLWPDRILHHMVGKLSTRHTYAGMYRDSTAAVFRHKRFGRSTGSATAGDASPVSSDTPAAGGGTASPETAGGISA